MRQKAGSERLMRAGAVGEEVDSRRDMGLRLAFSRTKRKRQAPLPSAPKVEPDAPGKCVRVDRKLGGQHRQEEDEQEARRDEKAERWQGARRRAMKERQ